MVPASWLHGSFPDDTSLRGEGAFCHLIAGLFMPFDAGRGEVDVRERQFSRRQLVDNPRDRRWCRFGHQLNESGTLAQTLAGLRFQVVHEFLHEISKSPIRSLTRTSLRTRSA